MKQRVYSVGQVNQYLFGLMDNEPFLHGICIKGEVSNLKYHSSGHIYFDLKDASGKIAAAMFRNYRRGLTYPMKDGDKIMVTGDVGVYTRNGTYQIVARRIEAAGAGDLFLRFEKLKKDLAEMGMFEQEYKKPIPAFVRHLGIVTAPTGAAVRDMIRIAKRRNPHIRITLYPALVQGEGAPESIAKGIAVLDAMGVDVIIAGRGGGSIEDLWAFNEELVARAIFGCGTPIISAVGHETDTTIADFVADQRAATPSEAAELAVAELAGVMDRLALYERHMGGAVERRLLEAEQRLDNVCDKLRLLHPKERLRAHRQRLVDSSQKLDSRIRMVLTEHRRHMDLSEEQLKRRIREALLTGQHRLALAAGRLDSISPLKRLTEGYAAMTTAEGKRIYRIGDVKAQDPVEAYVADGRIMMRVEQTEALDITVQGI